MKTSRLFALAALLAVLLTGCKRAEPAGGTGKVTLRLGHFPNITHAQALVARQLQRQGKGWFEQRLGPGVEVQWFVYNAGPSAMEAIFADSLDITYVGPNPVLNAYVKSKGEEVRVIAGAANGGAALVVQGDGRIKTPQDFKGRKMATPQLGGTQDVAARVYLKAQGFHITQLGGDVQVLPTANPDQLSLFQQKTIDAVWTVEPWVSRLELEAGGKIFLQQDDALTTVVAASVKFLQEHPDVVKKFAEAHAELTDWINQHPDEAKALVRAELKEQTKRDFPAPTADRAWPRLKLTTAIARERFDVLMKDAQDVGLVKGGVDLRRLLAPQQ